MIRFSVAMDDQCVYRVYCASAGGLIPIGELDTGYDQFSRELSVLLEESQKSKGEGYDDF
jgi:hypothetical protein